VKLSERASAHGLSARISRLIWNSNAERGIFKTSDGGKSWQALATTDLSDYAHAIREDMVNRDLLSLGTEFGLFISLDGGKQWAVFKGGDFPQVAVRDITVQPRKNDLLLATHGRGIWIIDDSTPLRVLTPEVLAKDATFLPSRPSEMTIPANEFGFNGDAEYVGRSASEEAAITYYQKKRHIFGDLKFEITDAQGNLVSTIPGSKRHGLNRIT